MIADEAFVDTVRLARDLGDVSGLLPTGIARLRDIPYALLQAIKAALVFLSFEELPYDDQPPRSIWTNTELLNEHFDALRRRSKDRSEGRTGVDHDAAQNDAMRMLIAG